MSEPGVTVSAPEAAAVFESRFDEVARENIKIILDRLWESGGPDSIPVIVTRDISCEPAIEPDSETSQSWRQRLFGRLFNSQVEDTELPHETFTEQIAATNAYLFRDHYERNLTDENGTIAITHRTKGSILLTRDGRFATEASEVNTEIQRDRTTSIIDEVENAYINPEDGYIAVGEGQLIPIEDLSDPEGLVYQLMGYVEELNSEHGEIEWYVDANPQATWLRPQYDEDGYVQIVEGRLGRTR